MALPGLSDRIKKRKKEKISLEEKEVVEERVRECERESHVIKYKVVIILSALAFQHNPWIRKVCKIRTNFKFIANSARGTGNSPCNV